MSSGKCNHLSSVPSSRYGLGSDEPQQYQRTRPRGNSGGFVDLGNEYQYGAGGHQASGANEIFAEEQGDKPWYVPVHDVCLDRVQSSILITVGSYL